MNSLYIAHEPSPEMLASAERLGGEIASADHIVDIVKLIRRDTFDDLMAGFPYPGQERESDVAEYFDMVAAMMAGDTDAAEAYCKTAANFRPRNLQIIAALRLSEVFNDFEGPVRISEREADMFGWQTDLGGMALRADFAQVSGEDVNKNTYEEIANSIVKVTAAAKLGVARG